MLVSEALGENPNQASVVGGGFDKEEHAQELAPSMRRWYMLGYSLLAHKRKTSLAGSFFLSVSGGIITAMTYITYPQMMPMMPPRG